MWYRDGKVAVTNGNKTIIGTSTLWLTQARTGDIFIGPDNGIYELTAVTDDTHANIKTVAGVEAYQGATLSNQNYSIIRNFAGTTNADLANKYVTLMNTWQTREDQFRAWHGGTLTGGWDVNGLNPGTGPYYPLTDAYGVTHYYKCPASLNQVGNADTLDTLHASAFSLIAGPGATQDFTVKALTAISGIFTGTSGLDGIRMYYDKNTYTLIYANFIHSGDANGLTIDNINSSANRSIVFRGSADGSTFTEYGRFDSSGNLLVGTASGSFHNIAKVAAEGAVVLGVYNGAEGVAFCSASSGGYNAANTALKIAKNTSTSRSINAAGTINASGADYAEYEHKSDGCGEILKGQIIGFDAAGKVTDKWSESISFGVKTTNPSYVGGDVWGGEVAIGKKPEQPIRIADVTEQREIKPSVIDGDVAVTPAEYTTVVITPGDSDAEWEDKEAQYAIELANFNAKLEAARQTVDRIAYSGKVPCNVIGAVVGDYIIAMQDCEGIKGIAVTDPDFSQYKKAVGRVRRILDDGRPEIAVIVH